MGPPSLDKSAFASRDGTGAQPRQTAAGREQPRQSAAGCKQRTRPTSWFELRDVLRLLSQRVELAEKPLAFLSEHYLLTRRHTLFGAQ